MYNYKIVHAFYTLLYLSMDMLIQLICAYLLPTGEVIISMEIDTYNNFMFPRLTKGMTH
jgi:hypothetical protein